MVSAPMWYNNNKSSKKKGNSMADDETMKNPAHGSDNGQELKEVEENA